MGYNAVSEIPAARRLKVVDMAHKLADTDTKDLIGRYLAGESENALAKSFGFSRQVVRRILRQGGIERRGRSEAEALKWARMSPDQRASQVAAAHEATRGSTKSFDSLCRAALSRQRLQSHATDAEWEFARLLANRGLATIPQQAIGAYNCDLGAFPVAVEIFGGNWHWHGRHLARTPERIRYMLDSGWHVLMVHAWPDAGYPLGDEVADHVVAYVEAARRDPAARREYRVIRGAGEILASGSADDDEVSIEWAFTNRRNPVTGRYESVPR